MFNYYSPKIMIKKKSNQLRLTLHPAQASIYHDPHRYKVVCCSRRFGKTRLVLSTAITKAINFDGKFDQASPSTVCIVYPTLKQGRAVIWNPLVSLMEGHPAVHKIYKSDFRITLKGKRPDILLRGVGDDAGDGLRGLKFFFACLDEVQDITPSAWTDVIQPALIDTQGSTALFTGTPKGKQSFFYELFTNEEKSNEWKSFHYTIYDNIFINRDEIEKIKSNVPPKIFSQEFLAGWESFEGVIYSELDRDKHLIPDSQLPTMYETIIGIDFGDVNPAMVVVGYSNETYYVIDYWENPQKNVAIEQHVQSTEVMRLVDKHNICESYADPSRSGLILSLRRAGVPRLRAGYNKVSEGNSVVNTLLFQNRLKISKSCERVFDVLSSYHRKTKEGVILDEVAAGQDDHLADSLRYILASREAKRINASLLLTPSNPQKFVSNESRLYR